MSESIQHNDQPSVDLPQLPKKWRWSCLGDLGMVKLGKTPRKIDYRDHGVYKMVKFRDVDETGKIDWDNDHKGYVSSSTDILKTLQELREGDVLVTASAHMSEHIGKKVGLALSIPKKYKGTFVVGELLQIRTMEGVDSRWVYYYLGSRDGYKAIQRRVHGVHLIGSRAQHIEIPVAPPEEQQRIVAEIEKQFSRLDEAVANLKRVKANLKRYKASVLKAAVEGKLTEDWRNQHPDVEPASRLLERILAERKARWNGKRQYNQPGEPETSNLPELPDKWNWARLEAIAALKGGITVDKNRNSSTARTVPYLRVANVQRGYLDLSEVKKINAPDADIKDLRLMPGDILFNEGGDRDKLGRGWVWEGQLPECIHQNHVFRARLYLAEVSSKLVSWWGNSFGQAYFLREGKQTTNLASLNLTKLSTFPIPLPPAAEQQQIVAEVERRLSVIEELEAAVEANLTRADRLRQSILSQAFAGKLGCVNVQREGSAEY